MIAQLNHTDAGTLALLSPRSLKTLFKKYNKQWGNWQEEIRKYLPFVKFSIDYFY